MWKHHPGNLAKRRVPGPLFNNGNHQGPEAKGERAVTQFRQGHQRVGPVGQAPHARPKQARQRRRRARSRLLLARPDAAGPGEHAQAAHPVDV